MIKLTWNYWHRLLLITAWLLLLSFNMFAQSNSIDSLSKLLQVAQHDSTRIDLHFQLYVILSDYDLSRADDNLETAFKLIKKENDKPNAAYYYSSKGGVLFDLAKYDESKAYYDTALVLYNELITSSKNPSELNYNKLARADCLSGLGLLSAKLYYFQESIKYYLDAIESISDIHSAQRDNKLLYLYANIASDYYELEEFGNALKYDRESLNYLNAKEDIDGYVIGHLFVADDYGGLFQFDSAFAHLEKVRSVVNNLNKPNLNLRFHLIAGGVYRKKKEWTYALDGYKKADQAALMMKDEFQSLNSEEGIAACYLNLGLLPKAREIAVIALDKSNRLNVPLGKMLSLKLLTEIEEKSGNVAKAFDYQKQFIIVSDSMKKEKVERQMHEIEMKYQNEKKEKEILELQKSNALQSLSLQKQSTFNYFLVGSIVALLTTGFLGYRNLRHRQLLAKQNDQLQQQRIRELEKDRQLVAVDSLLKGQEEERSRMAKDLHDGLGGILSGVKLSLGAMKGNILLSDENTRIFSRVLDQLDNSITEMRRVAHNMMPEALVKLGLQQAIQDYCDGLNELVPTPFKVQFHGLAIRMQGATEIVIYRIVQELLNNIVKHAAATDVLVQIMRHDNNLTITVEDNGKGFDVGSVQNKGSGLGNVRSRVDYLKGHLDIQSIPGKGTSTHIDFVIQDTQ
ncbi:MAG TPA: sensor histidine kinase [Chryseolinea sp.]|nr:sensor histidine kinase [Chryseolinea sp.]